MNLFSSSIINIFCPDIWSIMIFSINSCYDFVQVLAILRNLLQNTK